MRIVVDKMPDSVEECPFSKLKVVGERRAYICELSTYQPEVGRKVKCVCKSVSNCNVLVESKEE